MKELKRVLQLCSELLLGKIEPFPNAPELPFPPSLCLDYAKRMAAEDLGQFSHLELAQSALVRAALTKDEDDRVRIEAVQQLLTHRSDYVDIVLLGLMFDEDPLLRQASIEGLFLLKSEHLNTAIEFLCDDQDESVRHVAWLLKQGEEIPLYYLNS